MDAELRAACRRRSILTIRDHRVSDRRDVHVYDGGQRRLSVSNFSWQIRYAPTDRSAAVYNGNRTRRRVGAPYGEYETGPIRLRDDIHDGDYS